jgi:hypothetical protein
MTGAKGKSGGRRAGAGHTDREGRKAAALEGAGYLLLRLSEAEIKDGSGLVKLATAIQLVEVRE